MPFSAKSSPPSDSGTTTVQAAFEDAAVAGSSLIVAPGGYLLTEELSAALASSGRDKVWIRLGPEDRDPGTLLRSVVAAVDRCRPGADEAGQALMRRRPGPVSGWPPLFADAARELAAAVPTPAAVVIEHLHHLDEAESTLALLSEHLLGLLPDCLARIVVSHQEPPRALVPPPAARYTSRDLRIPSAQASAMVERSVPGLDGARAERAIGLADGQAVVLGAICAAGGELGPRAVERALARTGSPDELLGALARTWLTSMEAGARRTLALALELGYSHPALLAVIGAEPLPSGPWGQQLEGGWTRIRTPWRSALGRIGAMRPFLRDDAVHGAAEFLVKAGAVEQAVRLYLGLGDIECGALTIDREADRLVDLGQWETVNAWLEQLPEGVRMRHPRFLHRRAEIAAGEGRTSAAERDFAQAATLCTAQRDMAGACQSMLAESALAARRGDLAHARDRALAASRVTDGAGLRWQQLWADWQLGVLAALTGSLDDALPHFGRAIAVIEEIGEPPMLEMLRSAEGRTRRLHRVRAQREQHRQAYLALAAAEQETAADLLVELDAGGRRRDPLAARYGWSQVPMLLKGPPPASPPPQAIADIEPSGPADAPAVRHRRDVRGTGSSPSPLLTIHLLGHLRVMVDDSPIEEWPSRRGRSVLKYLIAHRDRWVSREQLMETFWPGSAVDAARNSLNVAMHGLRRALRTATEHPVVVLDDDTYRLHADVRLWVDTEKFQRHAEAGQRLEAAGDLAASLAEYELAAALYRGDFLDDDPYEEWPVLARERLRLIFLDLLDRLSGLYFSRHRYASSASVCQRIIERDPCREHTHRRLMRCYSRQGQPHLALRQYRACVEALRVELDVHPASSTAELHELIRRREPV